MPAPPLTISGGWQPLQTRLVLVRWNVGTGQGVILQECGPDGFHVEALPPGTYRYELWFVQGPNPAGSNTNFISGYNAIVKLACVHQKR